MRYRKLRIAWSVVWGLVAVLLLVLWVRSHRWADCFSSSNGYTIVSLQGELLVMIPDDTTGVTVDSSYSAQKVNEEFDQWNFSRAATPTWNIFFARSARLPWWFHLIAVRFFTLFLLSLVIAISTCPWIHWSKRFTVRTLLIATTLVAIVLGLSVWMVR